MNIMQQEIKIGSKGWLYVTLIPTVVAGIWTLWFLYDLAFSNRHTAGESMMQFFTLIFGACSIVYAIWAVGSSSQKRALGAACFALLTIGLIGGYNIGMMPRPDYGGEAHSYNTPLAEQSVEQGAEQLNKADPKCTGEKNEYHDIGYGIEHVYTGNITNNMPIKVVLSCDHERFTITGAISQIITGKEIKGNDTGELADTSTGSIVVYLDEDENKDGYNDLQTILSNGSQVDTYASFLYSPVKKQFVFDKTYTVDTSKLE